MSLINFESVTQRGGLPKLSDGVLPVVSKFTFLACAIALLTADVNAQTPEKKDPKAVPSQAGPGIQQVKDYKFDPKKIPHCYQGEGTSLCGVSSSLTIAQVMLGFDLSSTEALRLVTNIKSDIMMSGKSGTDPIAIYNLLGVDCVQKDYVKPGQFKDREAAIPLAEQLLSSEVVLALQQGKLVNLLVQAGKLNHCIAILDYDEKSQAFLVSDPARKSMTTLKFSELANKWPAYNPLKGAIEIEATFLTREIPVSSMLPSGLTKELPNSSQVILSDSCERLVAQGNNLKPATLFLPHVKSAYPDIKWTNVAYNWETGRDPQKVFGLPWLVKLNLSLKANDKFVCAIFPDGANKCQLVIVKGFKDGPTGEPFDGNFEIQTKNGTETISYLEFNKRCAAFKSSNGVGTFAYIGYLPNPPKQSSPASK